MSQLTLVIPARADYAAAAAFKPRFHLIFVSEITSGLDFRRALVVDCGQSPKQTLVLSEKSPIFHSATAPDMQSELKELGIDFACDTRQCFYKLISGFRLGYQAWISGLDFRLGYQAWISGLDFRLWTPCVDVYFQLYFWLHLISCQNSNIAPEYSGFSLWFRAVISGIGFWLSLSQWLLAFKLKPGHSPPLDFRPSHGECPNWKPKLACAEPALCS